MSRNVVEIVRSARRCSTPVVAISTADQPAFVGLLTNDGTDAGHGEPRPMPLQFGREAPAVVVWNCNEGPRHVTPAGRKAIDKIPQDMRDACVAPHVMIQEAIARFPEESVLIMFNAALFLKEPQVIQAIANARESFKGNRRTLLLLGTQFELPGAIVNDVVLLEEDLPGDEELARTLSGLYEDANLGAVPPDVLTQAVSAARGLSRFAAEQVYAMSLRDNGLDLEDCWARKREAINQTKGLTFNLGGPTFEQLGGLTAIRDEFALLAENPDEAPEVYIRIDEIEKMWAGASGGDMSGVSQDQLGAWLRAQEDNGWDGLIAVGPPGSGKTLFSRAMGATHGKPTIDVDFGAAKGSLVGESEAAIREMIRVIKGVGGRRVFVVATCNKLDALPPELRRRFLSGIWFFDLPTAEEREAIWRLQLAAFGLPLDSPRPDDTNWTGAEIRNCCKKAKQTRRTPAAASVSIVPVMRSSPDSVAKLREAASGKFLSASYEGEYHVPSQDETPAPTGGRRIGSVLKSGARN